jgi:hypothetical protein
MKCYYHPQLEAVAVCKHCHRGLCADCALEVSGGIACKSGKQNCPEEVREMHAAVLRGRKSYQNAQQTYRRGALLAAVIGGTMTLYGLLALRGVPNAVGEAVLPVGLVLLLLCVYWLLAARSYTRRG